MAAPMSSEGIVTVSYKTYRNTYQISEYVSFVEKVYRYTPSQLCSLKDRKNKVGF